MSHYPGMHVFEGGAPLAPHQVFRIRSPAFIYSIRRAVHLPGKNAVKDVGDGAVEILAAAFHVDLFGFPVSLLAWRHRPTLLASEEVGQMGLLAIAVATLFFLVFVVIYWSIRLLWQLLRWLLLRWLIHSLSGGFAVSPFRSLAHGIVEHHRRGAKWRGHGCCTCGAAAVAGCGPHADNFSRVHDGVGGGIALGEHLTHGSLRDHAGGGVGSNGSSCCCNRFALVRIAYPSGHSQHLRFRLFCRIRFHSCCRCQCSVLTVSIRSYRRW
mmetsp:Transcript_29339/g.41852  ORF Transcript_29339/g.41852 Transcript_29339/m.41852 type:complete len:268 (-) Transcript_29339:411-1214(-)